MYSFELIKLYRVYCKYLVIPSPSSSIFIPHTFQIQSKNHHIQRKHTRNWIFLYWSRSLNTFQTIQILRNRLPTVLFRQQKKKEKEKENLDKTSASLQRVLGVSLFIFVFLSSRLDFVVVGCRFILYCYCRQKYTRLYIFSTATWLYCAVCMTLGFFCFVFCSKVLRGAGVEGTSLSWFTSRRIQLGGKSH